MTDIRTACLRYDLELAIHRGMLDMERCMQAELNELLPEQTAMLIEHQQKAQEHEQQSQKP